MTKTQQTYHGCMECGEYTPDNESRYIGSNERELWICHFCDNKPSVKIVTDNNSELLRLGLLTLRIKKTTMNISNQSSAIAAGAALACAPGWMQRVARQAIDNQIRLDLEKVEAESLNLTVKEYRIHKALPVGLLGVSATGLQNFIDAIDAAVKK